MITLLLTVFLVVLISAICSMTEAALYSVPWTYIENLRKQGSATGELLYQLRSRIDQPIAAVLTLNTVANTAGAAIAGAVAANVLGADNTALFAAGLTILILALGEILPKTLGVAHACGVASGMARPLRLYGPHLQAVHLVLKHVDAPRGLAPERPFRHRRRHPGDHQPLPPDRAHPTI